MADRRAMFEQTDARLPLRRVGQPQDIAQAILFLATNPFATGSTVTVGPPLALDGRPQHVFLSMTRSECRARIGRE